MLSLLVRGFTCDQSRLLLHLSRTWTKDELRYLKSLADGVVIQLLNEHAVNASRFQPNPAVAAQLGELSVRCHRRAPWSHGRFEAVFVGLLRM